LIARQSLTTAVARDRPSRQALASALENGGLLTRAHIALLLANLRYWSTVAPLVRAELKRWQERAQAIEDPALRALALQTLAEEGFNAEVAATLATLAPRAHRAATVEAIVALELLYDTLDGLTESATAEAAGESTRLFRTFTDSVDLSGAPERSCLRDQLHGEERYLGELAATVKTGVRTLPAADAVAEALRRSAARATAAQIHIHSAPLLGSAGLERWAAREAEETSLHWREFLAGAASSVLGMHALIAAAADARTTSAQAAAIDRLYLSIAVLPTVLDSLVDRTHDTATGRRGYIQYYEDPAMLPGRLASVVGDSLAHSRAVPAGAHHVMTLVGVLAYYASAPTAGAELGPGATAQIARELKPLIAPTLAIMRAWRTAKRLHRWWRGTSATTTSQCP
jgi:tetraprenyl-beta-curcumene synthase